MDPRSDGLLDVQTAPGFFSQNQDTKASHKVKAINKKPFKIISPETTKPIIFATKEQSIQQGYYPIVIDFTNTGAISEPNMLKYIRGFKLVLITKQGDSNCLNDWVIQQCISQPIQLINKSEINAIIQTFNPNRIAGSVTPIVHDNKHFMPSVNLTSPSFDFVYVTMLGEDGIPKTFLAAGLHVFASAVAPFVLAAGEGFFRVVKNIDEDGKETKGHHYEIILNNGSGAYRVIKGPGEPQQEFEERYALYKKSALKALQESMGIGPRNVVFDPAPIDKNPDCLEVVVPTRSKKSARNKPTPLELSSGTSSIAMLRRLLTSPPTKIKKTDDRRDSHIIPEKSKSSSFTRLLDFLSPTKKDVLSNETPTLQATVSSVLSPTKIL